MRVLDMGIVPWTLSQTVEYLGGGLSQENGKGCTRVITVNPEFILHALSCYTVYHALQDAEIKTADGHGIVWAGAVQRAVDRALPNLRKKNCVFASLSLVWIILRVTASFVFFRRFFSSPFPERVTGSDLMPVLLSECEKKGARVYFLGSSDDTLKALKRRIQQEFPSLQYRTSYGIDTSYEKVANTSSPEFCELEKSIKSWSPAVLFVAFGMPRQELWIQNMVSRFPSVRIAIGVGGAFDMFAKKVKRAPRAFQRIHLEWLWRLLLQPRRLPRIFRAVFVFSFLVLRTHVRTVCGSLRQGVVGILLRRSNKGEWEVLIASRSDKRGHWQFPQGGIDKKDAGNWRFLFFFVNACMKCSFVIRTWKEVFKRAVMRELEEEVGFKESKGYIAGIAPKKRKYYWSSPSGSGFVGQQQTICYVVCTEAFSLRLGEEFSEAKWVPFQQAAEYVHPQRREVAEIALRYSPFSQ